MRVLARASHVRAEQAAYVSPATAGTCFLGLFVDTPPLERPIKLSQYRFLAVCQLDCLFAAGHPGRACGLFGGPGSALYSGGEGVLNVWCVCISISTVHRSISQRDIAAGQPLIESRSGCAVAQRLVLLHVDGALFAVLAFILTQHTP